MIDRSTESLMIEHSSIRVGRTTYEVPAIVIKATMDYSKDHREDTPPSNYCYWTTWCNLWGIYSDKILEYSTRSTIQFPRWESLKTLSKTGVMPFSLDTVVYKLYALPTVNLAEK